MEYKQGDTRADGYRFLAYEKRLRRPKMRKVADILAAYVFGERTEDEAVKLALEWREGVHVIIEKWAAPDRFQREIDGTRRKTNRLQP